MRLRGPWIIRGAGLDTSISSQSGQIAANGRVPVPLSPYTFYPGIIHGGVFSEVSLHVQLNLVFPPNADLPFLRLANLSGFIVPYGVEWRHVNP